MKRRFGVAAPYSAESWRYQNGEPAPAVTLPVPGNVPLFTTWFTYPASPLDAEFAGAAPV